MYVNVRSGRLGMKRPWLKYIEEENKMHCVTRKVKLTNVLSQKCVYSWTDNLIVTVEYHELSKNHQKIYENSYW